MEKMGSFKVWGIPGLGKGGKVILGHCVRNEEEVLALENGPPRKHCGHPKARLSSVCSGQGSLG